MIQEAMEAPRIGWVWINDRSQPGPTTMILAISKSESDTRDTAFSKANSIFPREVS